MNNIVSLQKKSEREQKVKASTEKISPQLSFSLHLHTLGNFKSQGGAIFEWVDTHWQFKNPTDFEKVAFQWLSLNCPAQATEKTAKSCVASAVLSLPELDTSKSKNSNTVLIPCKNGTVRVEEGVVTLQHPDQNDALTYCLTCDFESEEVPTPLFKSYLDESVPDAEVQGFLQEYLGYSMLCDCRHQIALWLLGSGENGKGVFAEISAALHEKVAAMSIGRGLAGDFALTPLISASLVLVDETPQKIEEQVLKSLISGDAVQVNIKNRDPITLRPSAKWIVNGNSLPHLSDMSDGFWRRWAIIKFDQKPRIIPLLARRIIENELSGVLNWAIEGLKRVLNRGGFGVLPKSIQNEKENARLNSCSVKSWFESAEPTMASSAANGASLKFVMESYKKWCFDMGMKPVSCKKLIERIGIFLPEVKTGRRSKTDRTETINLIISTPNH